MKGTKLSLFASDIITREKIKESAVNFITLMGEFNKQPNKNIYTNINSIPISEINRYNC